MNQPKEKIQYLEGLRGIAALVVVLYHFSLIFYFSSLAGTVESGRTLDIVKNFIVRSPLSVFISGNFAVCIFFALSGYVLSYKFFSRMTRKGEFNNSAHEALVSTAIKRYFRLGIPVFASFLVAYIFMRFSFFYNTQAAAATGSSWFTQFWTFQPRISELLHQALYGAFFNKVATYNPVAWTMTYEFLGSFLVFGFASLFCGLKRRYILYAIAMLLLMKTYYAVFFAGFILSDIASSGQYDMKSIRGNWFTACFFVVGLLFGSYALLWLPGVMGQPGDPNVFLHEIGAVCLMIALLNSKILQGFFSGRIPVFLGRISFGMYLLHLIIISSFSSYLFLRLAGHVPYGGAFLITFLVSMPVIMGVSYVFWKYVDCGAIRFSQFIYDRFFKEEKKLSEDVLVGR